MSADVIQLPYKAINEFTETNCREIPIYCNFSTLHSEKLIFGSGDSFAKNVNFDSTSFPQNWSSSTLRSEEFINNPIKHFPPKTTENGYLTFLPKQNVCENEFCENEVESKSSTLCYEKSLKEQQNELSNKMGKLRDSSKRILEEEQFAATYEGKYNVEKMDVGIKKLLSSENKINTQNQLLMNSLIDFYKVTENLNKMISIVNGDSNISLRIVDWFVTNYAKKYYTIYNLTISPNTCESSRFKVYNDYKLKLKAYSKKRFDPFCRWERTMLPLQDNKYIETTIGQLNFFKWAIENQVIDYINENYKEIENDMNQRNTTSKKKQMNGRVNTSISSVDSNVSTDTDISTDSENFSTLHFHLPSQPTENGSSSTLCSNKSLMIEPGNVYTKNGNLPILLTKEGSLNSKTRKKREELSVSACKCIKKESVSVVVKFL